MTKEIRASHILCSIEKSTNEEALTSINKVQKKLENGVKFSELAEEFSDCPSGSRGGDLGCFGQGVMVDEFDRVAFSLKENEISEIVETEFGYHLIQRTG
jgi:parvulin-like peptidyl-prolyl isomerase